MSESKKNKQEREWLIRAFDKRRGQLSVWFIDERIKEFKEITALIPIKYVGFISDYIRLLEQNKLVIGDLRKSYSEIIKKLKSEDPDAPPGPETPMLFSMYAKCYNKECSAIEVDEIRYECMYRHIYHTLMLYYYASKSGRANGVTPDQKGEEVEKMLQEYSKIIEQDVLLEKRNRESKDINEVAALEYDMFTLLNDSMQLLVEKIDDEKTQLSQRVSENPYDKELGKQLSSMYDLHDFLDRCVKYLKNPANSGNADVTESISATVQTIRDQVVALARTKELDKLNFEDVLAVVQKNANQFIQSKREEIEVKLRENERNSDYNYRY